MFFRIISDGVAVPCFVSAWLIRESLIDGGLGGLDWIVITQLCCEYRCQIVSDCLEDAHQNFILAGKNEFEKSTFKRHNIVGAKAAHYGTMDYLMVTHVIFLSFLVFKLYI